MEEQNPTNQVPVPTPPPAPAPVPPPPAPHSKWVNYAAGIVIVLALAAGTFYYLSNQKPSVLESQTPTPTPTFNPSPTPTPHPSPVPPPVAAENFKNWITVDWEPELIELDNNCGREYDGAAQDCGEHIRNFKVGTIKEGPYKGQVLHLSQVQTLGTGYEHYIFDKGERVYLDTASVNIGIRGIDDLPATINFPGKTGYQLKHGWTNQNLFKDATKVRKVFSDPVLGDFYLSDNGCLIVELPNHTALSYDFDAKFVNEEDGTVQVTVDSGDTSMMDQGYDFRVPSCGANCFYWHFAPEETRSKVKAIGKTLNGETIYGYSDPNDPALKEIYNDKQTVAYFSDKYEQQDKSKYTYEQFIRMTPVFFWADPLDRLIQFRNRRVAVAAEMCKPVIYLYPENNKYIKVTVNPNGGFTHTEPKYDNGWHVLATPSGKMIDLKTGLPHDYLFWEGLGLSYPRDEQGWVISRENLKSFLDEKLPQLGLQGQELADFEEYWLGRLTKKPYYQLTFVPKPAFDAIAPLNVSGNPDTMIRVMMTATGLDEYKSIPEQSLGSAPVRHGFTVVEWGGVVFE
jgi:hypothetical protein